MALNRPMKLCVPRVKTHASTTIIRTEGIELGHPGIEATKKPGPSISMKRTVSDVDARELSGEARGQPGPEFRIVDGQREYLQGMIGR